MQSIASGNALRVGENEVLVVGDGVLTLPTAMLREPVPICSRVPATIRRTVSSRHCPAGSHEIAL